MLQTGLMDEAEKDHSNKEKETNQASALKTSLLLDFTSGLALTENMVKSRHYCIVTDSMIWLWQQSARFQETRAE